VFPAPYLLHCCVPVVRWPLQPLLVLCFTLPLLRRVRPTSPGANDSSKRRSAGQEMGPTSLEPRRRWKFETQPSTTVSHQFQVEVKLSKEHPELTVEHAVFDSQGNLSNTHYTRFIEDFKEIMADDVQLPACTSSWGVLPGEEKPSNLRVWHDKKGAGWCVQGLNRSRWFSKKKWGSWRLAFLLARLQHKVWSKHLSSRDIQEEDDQPDMDHESATLPSTIDIPQSELQTVSSAEHDGPLRALIAPCEFAQNILKEIDSVGYVVLPRVLSSDEARQALSKMWDFVEKVSPTVDRSEPDSWYPRGSLDPWPHSYHDMMKSHQAGWIFGELREVLASRLFEPLYGTKELHCSKDGFCFQRPTRTAITRRSNDHYDQSSIKLGLQCIQGSVALLDQEFDDGCFVCWPGSHRMHPVMSFAGRGRDWCRLSEEGKASLRAAGFTRQRIPVQHGDVVLWRSDLVHCAGSPIGARSNFRAAVYVCMLPAQLTPDSLYGKKELAYRRLTTGSHWPNKEEWFRHRKGPVEFQPFFSKPPVLSGRLQELYGIRRYTDCN